MTVASHDSTDDDLLDRAGLLDSDQNGSYSRDPISWIKKKSRSQWFCQVTLALLLAFTALHVLARYSIFSTLDLRNRLISNRGTRRTAWFDKTYVVNMAHRTDRRQVMQQIGDAANIDLEFVQAFTPADSIISWVQERVMQDHIEARRPIVSRSRSRDVSTIRPSKWHGRSWRRVLAQTIFQWEDVLVPDQLANTTAVLWDAQSPAELSCMMSHYKIWSQSIRDGHKTILTLEDDIDIEFGIRERWEEIERKLPQTWDAVYLGYCYANELKGKVRYHPLVHNARAPWCTHAIAYSERGMRKLLRWLLEDEEPWTDTIDAWLRFLMEGNLSPLEAYSIVPPLVVQDKVGNSTSDIDEPGTLRPLWQGILGDSVLERLRQENGTYVPRTEKNIRQDQAIHRLSDTLGD